MRLLEAAGPIFADQGFHWAKVRDICASASANVAAVNYHFGDKLGLYTEVLRYSVAAAPRLPIGDGMLPPATQLRDFVRAILDCVFNVSRPAWHMKLLLQEMTHPTPALKELTQEFIRPRYEMLCGLIASLTGEGPKSRKTQLCAHSVVGQARHYLIARPVIEAVWPDLAFTPKDLDAIADHITTFSLAGIDAIRGAKKIPATKQQRAAKGRR